MINKNKLFIETWPRYAPGFPSSMKKSTLAQLFISLQPLFPISSGFIKGPDCLLWAFGQTAHSTQLRSLQLQRLEQSEKGSLLHSTWLAYRAADTQEALMCHKTSEGDGAAAHLYRLCC